MYRNIVPQNKCLSYFVVTVIKHYGQSNLGIKYLFCCTVQGYSQSQQEVLELEVAGHMAFTSRKQRTMNVCVHSTFPFLQSRILAKGLVLPTVGRSSYLK